MSFTPAFLDQLRSRLSIVDVVGRRVRLVKKGREHSGLCPFHNEKTPSFTVSEDKGFFHCFGCGAHGDVVGFVMRTENLSFPETVERLAAEAGMEVPRMAPGDREKAERLTGLAALSEQAAKWFESQLSGSAAGHVRDYLARRGVKADTADRFRLGYAPNSRTALKDAMIARGATEAALVECGLLIKPDDGGASYDRFRDRLMFPIADRRGRIVAFGGRTMGDASAKYLNSPETPLFHKGRMLYNHAMAREAAPKTGTVVAAEGYMDVIALAQAGFTHAVAPLGTALTEEQMGELWRLAPEPILCFDGDSAGLRAAQRAADRCLPLLAPGRSFRFALLPSGQDPDDLIRDQGRDAMAAVLDAAIPLAELLWRRETEGKAFDTPERRAGLRQDLDRLAGQVGDASVRELYQAEFRDRLRRFFSAPQAGGGAAGPARRQAPGFRGGRGANLPPPGSPLPAASAQAAPRRELLLLAALLNHPDAAADHAEELAHLDLQSAELDRLRRAILHAASRPDGLDAAALRRHLTEAGFADLVARLAGPNVRYEERFIQPGADRETVETGLSVLLAPWRRLALEQDLKQAEAALQQDQSTANLNRLMAIQRRIQDLKNRERALLLSDDIFAAPTVKH